MSLFFSARSTARRAVHLCRHGHWTSSLHGVVLKDTLYYGNPSFRFDFLWTVCRITDTRQRRRLHTRAVKKKLAALNSISLQLWYVANSCQGKKYPFDLVYKQPVIHIAATMGYTFIFAEKLLHVYFLVKFLKPTTPTS